MIKTLVIAGLTIVAIIWIDTTYDTDTIKNIKIWSKNNVVAGKAQTAIGSAAKQLSKATGAAGDKKN
jgi:hypothetical protein